jgi:hypothetical protein
MWGEIIAGEEGERERKRAKRLDKVWKQCLGRKKKQRAFLGGRKRNPNGSGKFWCADD